MAEVETISYKSENHGKYVCNYGLNDDIWTGSEFYDTYEDAVQAGKESLTKYMADPTIDVSDVLGNINEYEEIMGMFRVGKVCSPSIELDGCRILEDLEEQIYEEVGDPAEYSFDNVTKEHERELEKLLTMELVKWLAETNNLPGFYSIEEIETVTNDLK